MALVTVEKLRAHLKKYLVSTSDTLKSEEFRIGLGAVAEYLEVQEKRIAVLTQILRGLVDELHPEESTAEAAGVSVAEDDQQAGTPTDKTPFPPGVKWKPDAPTAAPGATAAPAQPEPIPAPDVVGRVTQVAPIPPKPQGKAPASNGADLPKVGV